MDIGGIAVKGIAALAPMAGVTDRAFREICALCGAAYFTSEMISAKGLIYKSQKTFNLIEHGETEKPFAVQLFGSLPEDFKNAAVLLPEGSYDIIDVNMGCPAPKIIKENSGCALMKNPDLCGEIVRALKAVTAAPVTVKIRSGWNKASINAAEVAKICEQAGASAVTVHGRTREQMYSGSCDLDIIKHVKDAVTIPVIGNGDINSGSSAENMLSYTKCDMVAVGRGAIGNPWLFSEINELILKGKTAELCSLDKKIEMLKTHVSKICLYKGETRGIKEARKHIAEYIRSIPHAARFRSEAFSVKSKAELLELCEKII